MVRPWFWPMSMAPVAFGSFLATHAWPSPGDWLRLGLVMLTVGPLVWASVFAVNDAYDVDTDRLNPRKAHSMAVRSRMTTESLVFRSLEAGLLAVVVAWLAAGVTFAFGTLVVVALGWAYSVPPLRLKARAGCDVLVNALVIGPVGILGGWQLERPMSQFPWAMGVLAFVVAAALYLPTTLIDLPADRAAGVRTTAVRLGERTTYGLSLAIWTLAVSGPIVLAALDYVFPRELLSFHVVTAPVLIALYADRLRRPSIAGLAVVAAALGLCFLRFVVALA
ncbi:hypothetical protein VV02_03555 [Luteipulveratus mongoliensis]|uniref:Uncharacterized protein n=1 Tax=Luteipulveratus mongoliensis TaxID=571913 RepID=A0A0K1JPV4_9MICO|nr:hypothetical protein VV02_03555 [Luteipulveratus mongoliensis]